jgi:hypothetical protein
MERKTMNKQEAHDQIADAIYWLRGYAAGCGHDVPAASIASMMAENLNDVQAFISASCPEDTPLNAHDPEKEKPDG